MSKTKKIKLITIAVSLILISVGTYLLIEKRERDYLYDILKKSESVNSIIYEGTKVEKDGETITAKIFENKKGLKRIETIIDKEFFIVFIDNENRTAHLFNTEKKTLEERKLNEYPTTTEDQIAVPWLISYTYMQKYNPIIVGEEVVDDKECIIIEYTAPSWEEEKTDKKMWIWKEHGLPIKSIITSKDGKQTTSFMKNLEVVDIPEEMFEIPKEFNSIE